MAFLHFKHLFDTLTDWNVGGITRTGPGKDTKKRDEKTFVFIEVAIKWLKLKLNLQLKVF